MMGTEQFSLKWNNHTNHLVDVFGNLLQAESLVDVTLSCEGRSLKAHKLVLSACSPYFSDLFQDHVENHPIVILKDVKFAELRCIIEFMYKGEVEVEKNDLDSLFLTAESLKIKGLTGSRPPVSGIRLRVPPTPVVAAEHAVDRKRVRPTDPFDTGGDTGGGGGGGDRAPPQSPPAGQPPTLCSNGEDSTLIKRPKLEPVSTEENSTDGMETAGAAGTAYLCRECGCSFLSQTQLQDHHVAAHARSGVGGAPDPPPPPPPPPPAVSAGGVIRGPPARGRPEEPSVAPPVHSHSWPPHDGRDRPGIWTGEGDQQVRLPPYLQAGLRPDVQYFPSLVGSGISSGMLTQGLRGGLLGMIHGHRMSPAGDLDGRGGPLNLSAGDGAASPGASEERSEPSTPTPAEDGGPVTCKVCTRAFDTPAALHEHASVHQGERPFKCDYCGKAFKFRHHLKDHCRIHTGERPFDCKICGKRFARSSILKTHMKIHKQEERRWTSLVALPTPPGPPSPGTALAEPPAGPAGPAEFLEPPGPAEPLGPPVPPGPPAGSVPEPTEDELQAAVKEEPTEVEPVDSEDSGAGQ